MRFRKMVRTYPVRSATWVIVPSIGAATALSDRFDLLHAVLFGAALGLAIGSTALCAFSKGWLESAD